MKSFGRLLRKLRGSVPLDVTAARAGVEVECLASVEDGRVILQPRVAERLVMRAFGLDQTDTRRLILGVELFDLGLKDNSLRQLVIDLIEGSTPTHIREQCISLYHRYRGDDP